MKERLLLQEEAGRKWLFNKKVIKDSAAQIYTMPALEAERIPYSQIIEEKQKLGYEEGFASGEKAGFAEGEQKAALIIDRLTEIINEITAFREGLVKEAEDQVVDLSIAIAMKIITEEVQTRPEILISIVNEALKKMQKRGTITIKINPALHELFKENHSSLLDIHEDIVFDVNENVPVTGPLVVSQTEEVVTDIHSMIANVVEEIKGEELGND
jgi:flagellar assembly protein FliH